MSLPTTSPTPWSVSYSPYRLQDGAELPAYEVLDADGEKAFDTNEDSPAERQEANAKLAAAAPELLDALDLLLEQTVDMDLKYGIILTPGEDLARTKALQAIEKATEL